MQPRPRELTPPICNVSGEKKPHAERAKAQSVFARIERLEHGQGAPVSRNFRLTTLLGPIAERAARQLIGGLALPPDLVRHIHGRLQVEWEGVVYIGGIRHRKWGFEPFLLASALVDIEGNLIRRSLTCGATQPRLIAAIRRITGWEEGKEYKQFEGLT